jgi:hypothetical protein
MILELKHKNFKDEYKIKERVKKKINIRRHMSKFVALELHYFQELLNWWHSPFKSNRIVNFIFFVYFNLYELLVLCLGKLQSFFSLLGLFVVLNWANVWSLMNVCCFISTEDLSKDWLRMWRVLIQLLEFLFRSPSSRDNFYLAKGSLAGSVCFTFRRVPRLVEFLQRDTKPQPILCM